MPLGPHSTYDLVLLVLHRNQQATHLLRRRQQGGEFFKHGRPLRLWQALQILLQLQHLLLNLFLLPAQLGGPADQLRLPAVWGRSETSDGSSGQRGTPLYGKKILINSYNAQASVTLACFTVRSPVRGAI